MKVDIRIIATTNKDLQTEVKKQTFREDLYFRLNVIPVHVPALRDRRDDIPLLARHFLRKYDRMPPRFHGFSEASMTAMLGYPWPGNVRELENAVNRAIVLASADEIRRQSLDLFPPDAIGAGVARTAGAEPSGLAGRPLFQIERDAIIGTLVLTSGNRTRAAEMLGISIRCLRNKLLLYAAQGIRPPGPACRSDA
jgi:DNA-binding NtrC family response regulator